MRMAGRDEDLLVMIDTGFNGDLMLSSPGARILGLELTGEATPIELGDGSNVVVHIIRTTIDWLEDRRAVEALVADAWHPMADAPLGLVGTRLLSPHLLLVDFADRTVEIETSE